MAIAIHNIPEGIAVSIPIFYATGDRKKAFKLSLLSGLAEPVGALLAYLVLMPFMSPTLMGCILAGVAGIMVFISIDELLPAAREYGEAHISIYGVVAGMALMARQPDSACIDYGHSAADRRTGTDSRRRKFPDGRLGRPSRNASGFRNSSSA